MVYITNQGDHSYCRIPTQFTECSSRSGISHARLNRMEIASKGIFSNMQKVGHIIIRPVCFTGEPPNPRLCRVEARPIQPRDRCISRGLVKSIPVCIPAIKQSTTRSGPKNDISNTNLAHTAMVSRVTEDEHGNPILLPKTPLLLKNPVGETHPLVKNGTLQLAAWIISGQNCVTQVYQQQLSNLSQNVADPHFKKIRIGLEKVGWLVCWERN